MRAAVAGEPGLTPRRAIVASAALVALLVLGSAVDAQDSGIDGTEAVILVCRESG